MKTKEEIEQEKEMYLWKKEQKWKNLTEWIIAIIVVLFPILLFAFLVEIFS